MRESVGDWPRLLVYHTEAMSYDTSCFICLPGPRAHPYGCLKGPAQAAYSELNSRSSPSAPSCPPCRDQNTFSPDLQAPNPWPKPSLPATKPFPSFQPVLRLHSLNSLLNY